MKYPFRSVSVVFLTAVAIMWTSGDLGLRADGSRSSLVPDRSRDYPYAAAATWSQVLNANELFCCSLKGLAQNAEGGYVVIGQAKQPKDTLGFEGDGATIVMDASGKILSQTRWGAPNADIFRVIRMTSDGGYVLAGTTYSFGSHHYGGDVWFVKTDKDLRPQWQKRYRTMLPEKTDNSDEPNEVFETSDGGYMIVMSWWNGGDTRLIRISSTGALLWMKYYDLGQGDRPMSGRVIQTPDGGYLILGEVDASWRPDPVLMKVDEDGEVVWQRQLAYPAVAASDVFLSALNAKDGGFLLAGYTWSYGDTASPWVVKTNATGEIQWQYRYKGSESYFFRLAFQAADGAYTLFGNIGDYGGNNYDLLAAKVSPSGGILRARFSDPNYDRVVWASPTTDGGFIMKSDGVNYLMKVDSNLEGACKLTAVKLTKIATKHQSLSIDTFAAHVGKVVPLSVNIKPVTYSSYTVEPMCD